MDALEWKSKAVELYQQGMESSEIGKIVGRFPAQINMHLRKAGIPPRRTPRIDWPVEQMRTWYEVDGLTEQQIADRLGTDRRAVNKVSRKHQWQKRRTGPERGDKHPGWKGGRHVEGSGYVAVYCPDHPLANRKYVLEHRLVMEQMLGRYLVPGEVVHHKNGMKTDNRPENLELFQSNAAHLAETLKGQCPRWTEDGIARIAEGFARQHRRSPSEVAAALRQRAHGSPQKTDHPTS